MAKSYKQFSEKRPAPSLNRKQIATGVAIAGGAGALYNKNLSRAVVKQANRINTSTPTSINAAHVGAGALASYGAYKTYKHVKNKRTRGASNGTNQSTRRK